MLKVQKVDANNDYTLYVELSDGRSEIFDVKPYLDKGVFNQLKDKNYFKQMTMDWRRGYTCTWTSTAPITYTAISAFR